MQVIMLKCALYWDFIPWYAVLLSLFCTTSKNARQFNRKLQIFVKEGI